MISRYSTFVILGIFFIITSGSQSFLSPGLRTASANSILDCSAQIQEAVTQVDNLCRGLATNSVCYVSGEVALATDNAPAQQSTFTQAGEKRGFRLFQSIATNSTSQPGLAAIRMTQANQDFDFVIFGTTELLEMANSMASGASVNILVTQNSNIQASPDANSAIVGQALLGQILNVDAVSPDGTWLRLIEGGWLSSSVVRAEHLDSLPITSDSNNTVIPEFTIHMSADSVTGCDATSSFLLVQNASSYHSTLKLNGTTLQIGSQMLISVDTNNSLQVFGLGADSAVDQNVLPQGQAAAGLLGADGQIVANSWSSPRPITADETTYFMALSQLLNLHSPPLTPTEVLATPTIVCAPRTDWPRYFIQAGDTLSSLAQRTGTSVKNLQIANCLSSFDIYAGQSLYVPVIPSPIIINTVAFPTVPPVPTAIPTLIPTTVPPTCDPLEPTCEGGNIGGD